MSDRPKSTPPSDDENPNAWEELSAFRRTFLQMFRPDDAAALDRVGRLLFDCALECAREWLPDTKPTSYDDLLAVVRDLRFMQGYLESMGREHLEASLSREGVIHSQLAESQAVNVGKIADVISARLDARLGG